MRCAVLYMLEAGMVLHLRLLHHGVLRRRWCDTVVSSVVWHSIIVIIVVSSARLVHEVCRSLVLVRAAIVLEPSDYLVDVR